VLVLADPQRPLTAEESAKIEQCIASGQDMLIAGKPGNQDILNPILAQLGIQFTPGTIVKPTEHFAPDLMVGRFTPQAMKFSPNFAYYANQGYSVTSVGTMGIVQVADKGFQVMPMIVADSAGCWLELETKEFFTETPVFNADKGEQYCSNMPIISILAREINNKLQKIVVLGNADCIGNGELLKSRKGIAPVNFGFISEMFRWYSNGEFPVDASRQYGPDNDIYLAYSDLLWIKILLMGLFPLILGVIGARTYLKREKH
jgi:ABC-2 type transport system permease protein